MREEVTCFEVLWFRSQITEVIVRLPTFYFNRYYLLLTKIPLHLLWFLLCIHRMKKKSGSAGRLSGLSPDARRNQSLSRCCQNLSWKTSYDSNFTPSVSNLFQGCSNIIFLHWLFSSSNHKNNMINCRKKTSGFCMRNIESIFSQRAKCWFSLHLLL